MAKFWELLEESVIIQGLMTVGLWGIAGYLLVVGKPIPEILQAGCLTILGFWFGTKTQHAANQATQAIAAAIRTPQ